MLASSAPWHGEVIAFLVTRLAHFEKPFRFERGGVLPNLTIAYSLSDGDFGKHKPVVWICHALTGNSNPVDWWKGMVGNGKFFDPDRYSIICANVIGSCYGSSGPSSGRFGNGSAAWGLEFPFVTVRDMVRAHQMLADFLGLGKIHILTGGSLGGQQALEWSVMEPERHQYLFFLAANAVHSSWGKAFNEAQRLALEADPTFFTDAPGAGRAGMIAARATGMLSYRCYETFERTQIDAEGQLDNYRASSYQRYQGLKLADRFNAHSYWHLSKAMDSHDIGCQRGGIEAALREVRANTLCVGSSSDLLFPVREQELVAQAISGASFVQIETDYGHDGFLIEFDKLSEAFEKFLARNSV